MVCLASDTNCGLVKTPTAECRSNPSHCNSKIRAGTQYTSANFVKKKKKLVFVKFTYAVYYSCSYAGPRPPTHVIFALCAVNCRFPDQMPDEEEPNISKFFVPSAAQQLDLTVKQDGWPSGEEGYSGDQTSDIQPARNKLISPKDIPTTITSSSLITSSATISRPGPSSATSTICTTTESVTEIKSVQSLNTHSPLSPSALPQLNQASLSHFTFDSSIRCFLPFDISSCF